MKMQITTLPRETEGEFKIAVSMSNKYLSIKAESHYRPQTNRRDIEISIETTKKDRSNLYQSLYAMLSDNTHYGYFKAAGCLLSL